MKKIVFFAFVFVVFAVPALAAQAVPDGYPPALETLEGGNGKAVMPPAASYAGPEIDYLSPKAVPLNAREKKALQLSSDWSRRNVEPVLSGGGKVTIEGHTDSQGADDANRALSQRRADAVRRVLEEAGVAGSRMRATGKGESAPVADNASAAGRALNRRVEIIVN